MYLLMLSATKPSLPELLKEKRLNTTTPKGGASSF